MKDDLEKIWILGIYDPDRHYGMLLHAGRENEVRITYEAMLRGAKSSGLNANCLKLLSPDEWTVRWLRKFPYTAVEVGYSRLLDGSVGLDVLLNE